MQIKCQERKRSKKLFFYIYFLPVTAEITKDSKRNSFFLKIQAKNKLKNLGNTRKLSMKKQAIIESKPRLRCYDKDPKNMRGITLDEGKDDCLTLNKTFLHRHIADSSTASMCT
jgi:hypothetical protein